MLSGKVIDTYVLSQSCKGCQQWTNRRETVEYHEWLENREAVCNMNHTGSSGSIEVEGMKKICSRSMDLYQVRYINYIGVGDTKSFKSVNDMKPYGPDVTIQKIECVDHVQKRMGSHLRALKNEWKGKKLSDGKSLSGKNRLTNMLINTLVGLVYYGNAIRAHCNSVEDMRQAIWFHKGSTDENPTHVFCPKGIDSWCPYQRAVHEGTVTEYKHKNNIPKVIMEVIKPTFKKLVATELLRKCMRGQMQNNNESFNSKVWKICPKIGFAGYRVVEIAVNDAVMACSPERRFWRSWS